MDLPPLRVLSLCSGIGALDYGIRFALPSARTVCYVERDPFAVECIVGGIGRRELDDAPVWSDLRSFDARAWRGAVDLVVAGFPCQPFSTASRGRRVALDLWPWVRRAVAGCRAPWVFLENVQRKPIERASEQLERLGYAATFDPFDAAEVGSASPRRRWWLLANAHDAGESALPVDAEMARLRAAAQAHEWGTGPARVLGMDLRASARMDRLRALGNAVVPVLASTALVELHRRAVFDG